MRFSEPCDAVAAAFVAAQAELKDPERGRKANTGKYQYEYASLQDCLPDARKVLAKHGLSILQSVGQGVDALMVTRILHKSGQWIETLFPFRVAKPEDPQAVGSVTTYARRYGALCALGLAQADVEDDDGKAGADAARKAAHHASWEGDQKRFFAKLGELEFGYDEVVDFCAFLDRPRPSQMTQSQRQKLLDFLGTQAGADKYNEYLKSKESK